MGMGIGINVQNPDAGEIKGSLEDVACGVWFTSTGKSIPKILKFRDMAGEIHTVTNIHVISSEEKFYCGILSIEYECDTIMKDKKYYFRLVFYVERREWKILWKNGITIPSF